MSSENPDFRWYIVNVQSGFESKIAQTLKDKAAQHGLEECLGRIVVPKERVTEVRRRQKIERERSIFPGYLLIQMDLRGDIWHLVKNIPKVTDFLGSRGQPVPISEEEAQRVVRQLEAGLSAVEKGDLYHVGDTVRVIDGPFFSFSGDVEEVDTDRHRLKVLVSIFGRATPVELGFSQVERS